MCVGEVFDGERVRVKGKGSFHADQSSECSVPVGKMSEGEVRIEHHHHHHRHHHHHVMYVFYFDDSEDLSDALFITCAAVKVASRSVRRARIDASSWVRVATSVFRAAA